MVFDLTVARISNSKGPWSIPNARNYIYSFTYLKPNNQMTFNGQEYIELYRIFTETILNSHLLAWNILIYLLKYPDRQKVKRQCLGGMKKVKKEHCNWICRNLLSPWTPNRSNMDVRSKSQSYLKQQNLCYVCTQLLRNI